MTNISYEIRDGTIDDASDICDLSDQLGYPVSEAEMAERLDSILNSDDHRVCVAVQPDGTVIAWIHVFKCQTVESGLFAEIGGIIVSEAFRRKGIGQQLLKMAKRWIAQQKLQKLRVRTQIEREDAEAFYLKTGFSVSKHQRVFDKVIDKED